MSEVACATLMHQVLHGDLIKSISIVLASLDGTSFQTFKIDSKCFSLLIAKAFIKDSMNGPVHEDPL